jgi:hypothetical protein
MADPPSSTTVLGDWYANVLFWRPHVALFVNATTFVPVLIPLAPTSGVVTRFPVAMAKVLGALGLAGLENQGRKGTTLRGYRSALDSYVLPRLGDVALQELRATDLDAMYRSLLKSGGRTGKAYR